MQRLDHIIGHLKPSDNISTPIATNRTASDSFQYTVSDVGLSTEQRQFYETNGFVVIKKLLTPSEVSTYYNRFDELVANPKERSPSLVIMRDVSLSNLAISERKSERVVTKLQQWAYDRVFWNFAKHPKITSVVSSIVGDDIRAHHFMSINKPSDPGRLSSRHPLHQDQWYFPFLPSARIVCAWTALQSVHRSNGCLCVVPGTHKRRVLSGVEIGGELQPHAYPTPWNGPVNKAYHGLQLGDNAKTVNALLARRVHLEMEEGDTVFFHPLLVHGSGANLTTRNRRSISVHYCNSKEVRWVPEGVIPEQRRIAKEVEAMAERKAGFKVTFEQVWKLKSRQVQGDQGCFKL